MAIRSLTATLTGISPLLMNNPQTVDRFNHYAKRMSAINRKGQNRTDDDYREVRDLEMQSRLYFSDELGVYVPTSWLTESIAKNSYAVSKVSKDKIRGAVFSIANTVALDYRDKNKVKKFEDVAVNPVFRHHMTVPQGKNRLLKCSPIFHDWSFSVDLEFDDKIVDPGAMKRIIEHGAKYGGFGDFRPKFGRAVAEVEHHV